MSQKNTVLAHSENALGGGGVFLGDTFQASQVANLAFFEGYSVVKGYVNSPQAGTLDIYQGSLADIQAVLAGVPAAGVSNGILCLDTFAHPGGAAFSGTVVAILLAGPFLVARFTNGGVAQTAFRLHLEATE